MEGCHPQPTPLFSVVKRWILKVPPGPDFLEDDTTRSGPFGGPNMSAGVLTTKGCWSPTGWTSWCSKVSWISPSGFSSKTKGRASFLGGVITTPSKSSIDSSNSRIRSIGFRGDASGRRGKPSQSGWLRSSRTILPPVQISSMPLATACQTLTTTFLFSLV